MRQGAGEGAVRCEGCQRAKVNPEPEWNAMEEVEPGGNCESAARSRVGRSRVA